MKQRLDKILDLFTPAIWFGLGSAFMGMTHIGFPFASGFLVIFFLLSIYKSL